jgi:hypothetical protein
LHRLGFSYKKAKAVPGKAKKEDQELFILEYSRLKVEGTRQRIGNRTHLSAAVFSEFESDRKTLEVL